MTPEPNASLRRHALLCITGGVAAYKGCDLARRLMERRFDVRVVMTEAAERFVTRLTFEALTGHPVGRSLAPAPGDDPMPHITLARWANVMVVAPATANVIGRMAHATADDLVTATLLAFDGPLLVAPAMNTQMYRQPGVAENLATLRGRGIAVVEPGAGLLACGEEGEGKLAPVEQIADAVEGILGARFDLAGWRIVVTAGGTREPIDPVRYIGNRSSGKMGIALAAAAWRRGADVTLIAAALETPVPEGLPTIRVETAAGMRDAVLGRFDDADALVMAAAVGDYRAEDPAPSKVKKRERWELSLVKNPDIVAEAAARKGERIVVGFAAETDDPQRHGREKLSAKGLDMVVVNDVSRADIGFGSDDNEVTIIPAAGEPVRVPKGPKGAVADAILDAMAARRKVGA